MAKKADARKKPTPSARAKAASATSGWGTKQTVKGAVR